MSYSIPLIRTFRTAGSDDGPAHVLFNNNYVIERSIEHSPTLYSLPGFSSSTGTYDYYGSSYDSVFVIYTRPSITLTFTGNTDAVTGDTRLIGISQEIYKVRRADVEQYRSEPNANNWQRVANSITQPIVVYSSMTSAVTSAFTISILAEQFIKPERMYTEEMFEDRCEYFLNMRFMYNLSGATGTTFTTTGSTSAITATTLTINTLSDSGAVVSYPYSSSTFNISNDKRTVITRGSWSGLTVYGLFFSCFQPPSKPIMHFPFPATAITQDTTFTPTFNFSNVEDGDSFVLEVTYDMTDTGFNNTNAYSGVTQYFREKTPDSLEQTVDRTTASGAESGYERSTSIRVRRINAPIRPNSMFLYRIGNIKTIKNIFDVEQRVINYSTFSTGATGSRETIRTYVDSRIVEGPTLTRDAQGNQGNGTTPTIIRRDDITRQSN